VAGVLAGGLGEFCFGGQAPPKQHTTSITKRNNMECKNSRSDYFYTLDNLHQLRYVEKISAIGFVDPYCIEMDNFVADKDKYPDVTYPDIVNYMLFARSSVTSEELKCYKGLESYNQFLSGWVKDVKLQNFGNKVLFIGRVAHSQKLSEAPLQPWLIIEQCGKILFAHCNCMAGLGECCSHIGAVLFHIEATVKMLKSKTVTEEKAYWMLPGPLKKGDYKRVRDIDFTSPKTLKKTMNKELSSESTSTVHSQKFSNKVHEEPTENELYTFFTSLSKCGSKPAILSVVSPFSKSYTPSIISEVYPKPLTDLFQQKYYDANYIDLLEAADAVTLSISTSQITLVEEATRGQQNNKKWNHFRAGRITASRMHQVCHTSIAKPSQSLIKRICYPASYQFSTAATNWGCQHEKEALEVYKNLMDKHHEDLIISDCGFYISEDNPYIGASPDGLVSCKCCGTGSIEVKCPFCKKHDFILDATDDKKFCLEQNGTSITLKSSHPYFYQVQTQTMVCKKQYCDFFLWTEKDYHLERVYPDAEFWQKCLEKASAFFSVCILPELIGKFYSRPSLAVAEALTDHCYCQQTMEKALIQCCNNSCAIKIFHKECLRVPASVTTKNWLCPECQKKIHEKKKRK